jgi:hypothetical protein
MTVHPAAAGRGEGAFTGFNVFTQFGTENSTREDDTHLRP